MSKFSDRYKASIERKTANPKSTFSGRYKQREEEKAKKESESLSKQYLESKGVIKGDIGKTTREYESELYDKNALRSAKTAENNTLTPISKNNTVGVGNRYGKTFPTETATVEEPTDNNNYGITNSNWNKYKAVSGYEEVEPGKPIDEETNEKRKAARGAYASLSRSGVRDEIINRYSSAAKYDDLKNNEDYNQYAYEPDAIKEENAEKASQTGKTFSAFTDNGMYTYDSQTDYAGANESDEGKTWWEKFKSGFTSPEEYKVELQKLNDEERNNYYYLYNKEGKDVADQYYKDIVMLVDKRTQEEFNEQMASDVNSLPFVQRLAVQGAGYATTLLGQTIADTVASERFYKDTLRGNDINPYDESHILSNSMSEFRNIVTNNVENAVRVELFGKNVAGELLNMVSSAFDSKVGLMTFGAPYTVLMGVNAFAKSAEESIKNGDSSKVAMQKAAVDGAAETLSEIVGLELLNGVRIPKGAEDFVWQLLKIGVNEGSEEVSGDVFKELLYNWIDEQNGITPEVLANIQSYVSSGMDQKEAEKQVVKDRLSELFWSFASGFGSGILGGAGKMAVNYAGTSQYGEFINSLKTDKEVVELIAQTSKGKTKTEAAKIKKKIDSGEDVSDSEIGGLVTQMKNDLYEQNASGIKTRDYAKMRDANNTANKLLKLTGEIKLEDVNSEILDKTAGEENADKSNISKITNVDKGNEEVKLKNGNTARIGNIEFANKSQERLYTGAIQIAQDLKLGTEGANAIFNGYKTTSNVEVGPYLAVAREGILKGMYGTDQSLIVDEEFRDRFTSGQLEYLESIGRQAVDSGKANMDKLVSEQPEMAKSKITTVSPGTVTLNGKIMTKKDIKKLSGRQQTTAAQAMILGQCTKYLNFELIESEVRDGKVGYMNNGKFEEIDWNGNYSAKGNVIQVDLNAGKYSEGIGSFTLSHELAHYVREWSPEEFKRLGDFVVGLRIKNGEKISFSDDLDYEEFVARSLESMLTDDKQQVIANLAELRKNNRSLFDKMRAFINNFSAKIKNAYKDVRDNMSPEGRFIRDLDNEYSELQKMFAEAINAASISQEKAVNDILASDVIAENPELTNVKTNKNGDLLLASTKDGDTMVYSPRTWDDGGKEMLVAELKRQGYSTDEIKSVTDQVDKVKKWLLDMGIKIAKEEGYTALSEHLEKAVVYTDVKNGKQAVYALVNNGDYPVNIDLSLICKKRVAYMRLMNRLIEDGVFENVKYDGKAIAMVNQELRDAGFETACLGCFVESRRLQIQNWAEIIVQEWNDQVDRRVKNAKYFNFAKNGASETTQKFTAEQIVALETELNQQVKNEKGNVKLKSKTVYAKMGELMDKVPSLQRKLTVADVINPEGITAIRNFVGGGNIFSLIKQRYGAGSPKIVQDFNPYNSEILKLSFTAIKDMIGESITGGTEYLKQAIKQERSNEKLNKQFLDIFVDELGLDPEYDAKHIEWAKKNLEEGKLWSASNGTKGTDTYDKRAMIKKYYRDFITESAEPIGMREYLMNIGGARIQSFSDFMIENVFDYLQIVADLSARKYPMHGYTKEAVCIRLFGMTGQKWNGSVISAVSKAMGKEKAGLLPESEADKGMGIKVNVDGKTYAICADDYARNVKYGSFVQSIGLKDIIAMQLDSRYSKYVGSITIGVSDLHIRAMLNNPLFRMVIPYHKSGMLPEFAELVGVDLYNDYSDWQETKVGDLYDRNGDKFEMVKEGSDTSEVEGEEIDEEEDDSKEGTGNGKKGVYLSSGKFVELKVDTTFKFNEALRRHNGDAKAAANEYVEWCRNKRNHPITYNIGSKKYIYGYAELKPKFSSSPYGYDFTQEDNYYKLLEDFNTFDSVTEQPAMQETVKMVFPSKQNMMSNAELKAYKERLMATGLYDNDEIKEYARKANMTFEEIIESELKVRAKYNKIYDEKFDTTVNGIVSKLYENKRTEQANDVEEWKSAKKKGKSYATVAGTYLHENDDLKKSKRDEEYLALAQDPIKNETRLKDMVENAAKEKGFYNTIPEQTLAYKTRTGAAPKRTVKVYKTFTLSENGKPSALFVSGADELPIGVWLDAQDTWHFTAENGKDYVPSTKNPNTKGGKTGASIKIPNSEIKNELVKRGFVTEKANNVTALAYRPGWHAGDLPFFPQGGKAGNSRLTNTGNKNKEFNPDLPETNYENIHRYNQVVFECEMDADTDYTEFARSQPKALSKNGKLIPKNADMQSMPSNGFYWYTTNPAISNKGNWAISGSLKIVRALTQEECDSILSQNGYKPQEWEGGKLDLASLGYTGDEVEAARKTLAPITYDDNGNIIPLSERFNNSNPDVRYSKRDSNGNSLSPQQQEFFNDSKVRDYDGNLLVVYHGTPDGGFTVFDPNESLIADKPSVANWFSDNEEMINKYYNVNNSNSENGKSLYSVYLNIKNPLIINAHGDSWNSIKVSNKIRDGINYQYTNILTNELVTSDRVTTEHIAKYAKEHNYDGVIIKNVRDGSINESPSTVYATFSANQIKDTENKNPTSDPDIRYSTRDSLGNDLSLKQQEFFKDSKVRDDDGNLLVVYHGTKSMSFTKFNTHGRSGVGTFFSDNPEVSASYANTTIMSDNDIYHPAKTYDIDTLSDIFDYYDYDMNVSGNKIFISNGEEDHTFNSEKEASEWAIDNLTSFDFDHELVYGVYLNLKNPLIIDAEERSWDMVPDYDNISSQIEYATLYGGTDGNIFPIEYAELDGETVVEEFDRKALEKKFGKDGALTLINGGTLSNLFLDKNGDAAISTTNDWTDYAYDNGYDGVIFKNIYDGGDDPSNVYVAFDANQIKDTENKNPTTDDDIRYQNRNSIYMSAINSGDMAKAQNIVDRTAKEAGYTIKAYHGTSNGRFTTFDKSKIGTSTDYGLFGKGFYFSTSKNTAELYKGDEGSVISAFINVGKTYWLNGKKINEVAEELGMSEDALISRKVSSGTVVGPAYEFEGAFTSHLKENGYNSVIVQHGKNYEIVAFDSSQIKSADTVVYDDSGNIIPLSERFRSDNDDIRYQRRDTRTQAERDAEVIRGLKDLVRIQGKSSQYTLKSVEKIADDFIEETGTDSNKKDIVKELRNFYVWLTDKGIENANIKEIIQKASNVTTLLGFPNDEDLSREVFMSIFDAEATITVADKDKKRISELKAKHRQDLLNQRLADEMYFGRQYNAIISSKNQTISDLRAERDARLADLRAEKNAVISEVRTLRDKKLADAARRYQEQKKAIYDTQDRRELRERISKNSKKILELLIKPDEKKHIPPELIPAVTDFCETLNGGGTFGYKKMDKLFEAFESLKESPDAARGEEFTELSTFYDAEFVENINELKEILDGKHLIDLNSEELGKVWGAIKYIKAVITKSNKAFSEGIKENISMLKTFAYSEIAGQRSDKKRFATVMQRGLTKPVQFFDALGSPTLKKLYTNIRNGELTWATVVENATKKRESVAEKYNYYDWCNDKFTVKIEGMAKPIELTVEEAMSIYATYVRASGENHLMKGGIVLERDAEKKLSLFKNKNQEEQLAKVNSMNIKLTIGSIANIINNLTADEINYANAMIDYISNDMAELGNSVSLKMFNMRKFNEKNYFPISSSENFLYSSQGNSATSDNRIKHMSMTKKLTPKASNPIVIQDFTKTVMRHCSDMGLYYGLALPLEDFNRVYNARSFGDEQTSLKQQIERVYGKGANQYIKQLQSDINGNNRKDSAANFVSRMTSKAKKSAVFASLSVAVQQPSAIGRAMYLINPKYFVSTTFSRRDYNELRRHAPVAIIKDMGYFDTGVGRQVVDYMTAKDPTGLDKIKEFVVDGSYRDEILSKLPSLMDEVTWAHIWNATKAEITDAINNEYKVDGADLENVKIGTPEFYKACSDRFTYVIDRTQVYDSVFSRAEWMRSKDTGAQVATAFLAEPLTSLNMLYYAGVSKNPNKILRAIGAFAVATAINSAFKSVVTTARHRDDDDEDSYLEDYIYELITNFLDDINPLKMIPYVKDFMSLLQGYDSSRMDTQVVADLASAVRTITNENKSDYEKVKSLLGAVGIAFGQPVKNLWREFETLYINAKNIANDIERGYTNETTETGIRDKIKEALDDSKLI